MNNSRWDMAHIITKLELGGAQLATLYETEHATFPTGNRYLIFGPGGMLDAEAEQLDSVQCFQIQSLMRSINPKADTLALHGLIKTLRNIRAQNKENKLLVHTHSSKAGILGRMAARASGADMIVHTIHGFGHHKEQGPLSHHFFLGTEQSVAHLTDGFTADSQANLDQAAKESILYNIPARVVRCGIDVQKFSQPSRQKESICQELGIDPNHPIVLNISCLKPQKDPLTYVRMASLVTEKVPQAVFLLAGDGELRPSVEQQIRTLNLQDNVHLLGWRQDIPDLLNACDVLSLTSLWEGLPQVFAQAMAASKPIVATRVDGAPEAITHDDNGLLFSPGDASGLCKGVLELLQNHDNRIHMGRQGRKKANAFSQEKMVADLDAFYDELAFNTHCPNRMEHAGSQLRFWKDKMQSLFRAS